MIIKSVHLVWSSLLLNKPGSNEKKHLETSDVSLNPMPLEPPGEVNTEYQYI